MFKKILIIIVSINCLVSFYNWGYNAYWAKQSANDVKSYELMLKSKGDNAIEKERQILPVLQMTQLNMIVNKRDWLLKSMFDFLVFCLVLIYCNGYKIFRLRFSKSINSPNLQHK